jgi:hypothetical protein
LAALVTIYNLRLSMLGNSVLQYILAPLGAHGIADPVGSPFFSASVS